MNNKEIETKIEKYIQGWPDYWSFRDSHLKYVKGKGKPVIAYGIDYQFGEVIFVCSPGSTNGILYVIDENNYGYAFGSQNVWMASPKQRLQYPVKSWKWTNENWNSIGGTSWGGHNREGVIIIPLNKIISTKINFINWVNNNPFIK